MALLNVSVSYKTITKLLLLLFFPLVSLYILPSGGFQLVDISIVLIILFAFATVTGPELDLMAPALIGLSIYMAWVTINSFLYFVFRSDVFYVKVIIQNIFVWCMFSSFSILFQRLLRSRDNLPFVVFALFTSVVPVFFVRGATDLGGTDFNIFGGRGALSFNNPNQLGYYSVLILSILVVVWIYCSKVRFTKRQRISINVLSFIVFSVSHFLVIYSASRAAIGAMALLDLMIAVGFRRLIFKISTVLVPIFIVFILSPFGQAITKNKLIDVLVVKRFTQENIQADVSTRTLGLFFRDLPSEAALLYGGGKTVVRAGTREVHNAVLDVLLSYGLVGLCCFLVFAFALAFEPMRRRFGFERWIYLYAIGPTFAYNMFHNGFRFRLMWVFLALWQVLVVYAERPNTEAEPHASDAIMVQN